MNNVHDRLERLRAKLKETLSVEAPGLPPSSIRAVACMPFPTDDKDLIFFYGDGVISHADFDFATTRLSELLQEDGIETVFVPLSRAAYEASLATAKREDVPEGRVAFLATACGYTQPPDNIVSAPLLSPAVLSFTLPGASGAVQYLVV